MNIFFHDFAHQNSLLLYGNVFDFAPKENRLFVYISKITLNALYLLFLCVENDCYLGTVNINVDKYTDNMIHLNRKQDQKTLYQAFLLRTAIAIAIHAK